MQALGDFQLLCFQHRFFMLGICCDGPQHNVCSNPLGMFRRVFYTQKKKQIFTSQELLLQLRSPSSLLARRRGLANCVSSDGFRLHSSSFSCLLAPRYCYRRAPLFLRYSNPPLLILYLRYYTKTGLNLSNF
jgi:hypothetical protein